MKLFTLEYQVDFPRTIEEIANSIKIALAQEAELRGWEHGYTFYECQQSRQLPTGGTIYTYEVDGTYCADGNESGEPIDRQGATSGSDEQSENNAALPAEANT